MVWFAAAMIVLAGLGLAATVGRRPIPCPSWLAALVEIDNPFFPSNSARAIIAGLEVARGMRVLDAGCGPGRLTIPLAQAVGQSGRVTAVDLQEGMLARVRARAEKAALTNIDFVSVRLGAGDLPEHAFDRAVMVAVLGEIPDQTAAMRELSRALQPSGILAISEWIADPHFQRQTRVLALARDAGLREKSRIGHPLGYTLYLQRAV